MMAYFRYGAAGPAVRAARIHQAPALARVASVVVEDPVAVRARFQPPPPAVRGSCQRDGEHVAGDSAWVVERDAAVLDHRAQAEPGGPCADEAGRFGRSLDCRAQVVPEFPQLPAVASAHTMVPRVLTEAIGRHPGVVGDQPAVEQLPDLLQVTWCRL